MVELQEVAQGLPHSGNPSFQRLRVYGSVAIKHGRPSASAGDPVLDVVEGLLGLLKAGRRRPRRTSRLQTC